MSFFATHPDVAQIDIPTLLDVRTCFDRLLVVFDKDEMHRFIVVIYSSLKYIPELIVNKMHFPFLVF